MNDNDPNMGGWENQDSWERAKQECETAETVIITALIALVFLVCMGIGGLVWWLFF